MSPHMEKFMLFVVKSWNHEIMKSFATINTFVAKFFCRNLHTFVWRKIYPKFFLVEKKLQIWGLLSTHQTPILENQRQKQCAFYTLVYILELTTFLLNSSSYHLMDYLKYILTKWHKGRHQEKINLLIRALPKTGGGGFTLARIFWSFFHQVIVPKKVMFYPKLTILVGFFFSIFCHP